MIIDVHAHLPTERCSDWSDLQWELVGLDGPEVSAADVARIVRASPIDRMILCGLYGDEGPTVEEMRAGNRRLAEAVRACPDLFRAYCSVNPHCLEESLEEMDHTVRNLGFVGIGEVCPHPLVSETDTPEVRAIIEKAVELDVPLNIHSSEPHHYKGIAGMADQYPSARIIMAHFGGFRFWRDAIETIKDCENVWVDCSAWVLFTMGAFESTVNKIGASRVLFGTDFPLCDPDTAAYKLTHSGLSQRQVDLIGFENAKALFKLKL